MLKKVTALSILAAFLGLGAIVTASRAQVPEETPDFTGNSLADFADEETMKEVASGGVPIGRWKEGLLFEGIAPQPWLTSAANWLPGSEEVQPEEMRITFMGTAPMLRPGQMNTSIYVELGNGDTFIFDMREGAVSNYLASGIPINQLNDIFLSHLHVDHFGSLPWVYAFGAWAGRWHEPLRITGPSGRTEKDGVAYMVEGMKQMMHWHREAFSVFPVGWEIEVNEFDFADAGGTAYEKNGVKVIHWPASHAKDGASGYRLEWNGLSFCFTGDTRPNTLDIEYCKGVDVMISETQPEVVAISSGVQGVPPFVGRYTMDTHHSPSYAVGYIFNQIKPRMAMTTHMPYDPYINAETIAEIREHWKGPFHFGAPDMVVVNVTEESIWVRDGVIPDYPNVKAPNADASIQKYGGLIVPTPPFQREDLQSQFIRDAEIDPDLYYPEGYHPVLMEHWPTDKPIFIPEELVPESMKSTPKEKSSD
jgi:ribonuclease BN (tRNA processing enzyme)